MDKPYIIGIAGESGVGKSTIAEIVSLFYGIDDTTIISTDDLHKWERANKMWSDITHLNPDANNLELGDMHVTDMAHGKFIYRSVYNHKTGHFDPPMKIEPKKIVIIEGLHAFYTDVSKDLLGLKIFVDTDETLRVHWKIIRDTEERGYTYNSALDAINKRRADSYKIRQTQMAVADVVIRLTTERPITHVGNRNEKVKLVTEIHFNNDVHHELFEFVKSYIADFNKFTQASEMLGHNIELCQNGGGNISVKLASSFLAIKASGFNLKDVHRLNGYSILDYKASMSKLTQDEYDSVLNGMIVAEKYKRPSMETGFHILLKKHVIHLHPIYLTTLLCLENSKDIINKLFSEFDYAYVDYANPGFQLYEKFCEHVLQKEVIFLENHGLIVSSEDMKVAIDLVNKIHEISKQYIKSLTSLEEFGPAFADHDSDPEVTFPDAAVFHDQTKKEILAAHNYVTIAGKQLGKLRYLSNDDVSYLRNLESEKYRKSI